MTVRGNRSTLSDSKQWEENYDFDFLFPFFPHYENKEKSSNFRSGSEGTSDHTASEEDRMTAKTARRIPWPVSLRSLTLFSQFFMFIFIHFRNVDLCS